MSKDRKKLLHIHSSVNDKQPTPATLELGELGVNNAKGNAFISTKNSNGEVVRFSEDETIIGWMEQKEVFPYEGYMRGADNSQVDGVTEQDLLDNKSNLIIKLNQVVPENTDYSPYDEKVNGAKDIYGNLINPISSGGYKDGAGLAIDMSKYAMIGANPSFSSITTTCHATLNGTTEVKGKGDGCGSKFTVEVANACIDASDTLNEYGVNHSNFGTSCNGTKISNDTTLKGKKVFIDSPSGNLTVDIQACNHISGRTNDFVIRECQDNGGKVEIDTTDIDVSASTTDIKSCDRISAITNDFQVKECDDNGKAGISSTTINNSANTIDEKACTHISEVTNQFNVTECTDGQGTTTIKSCKKFNVKSNDIVLEQCGNSGETKINSCKGISAVTDNFIVEQCSSGKAHIHSCEGITLESKNIILTDGDCGDGEATIEVDDLCLVGNTKVNLYGDTTNVGLDCDDETVATNTNIYGKDILISATTNDIIEKAQHDIYITAVNKLCEKGRESYFYGTDKTHIGMGCDGEKSNEIIYERIPDVEACGIKSPTIDEALHEVLNRSKVWMDTIPNIAGDSGETLTTYVFYQDYTDRPDETCTREIGRVNIPKDHLIEDVEIVYGTVEDDPTTSEQIFTECSASTETCHWYIKMKWYVWDGSHVDKITYLPADSLVKDIDDNNSYEDRGVNVNVWYNPTSGMNEVSADTKLHFTTPSDTNDFDYKRSGGEHYESGTTIVFKNGAYSATSNDDGVAKYKPWSASTEINIPTCAAHIGRAKLSWDYGDMCGVSGGTYDPADKCDNSVSNTIRIPGTISDLTHGAISMTDGCSGECINISTDVCMPSNKIVANGFFSRSDVRSKENIKNLTDEDLEKVGKIAIKSFNFKEDESKAKTYGVIAQDVQAAGLDNIIHTTDEGMLNVDYISLLLLKIASMEKTINTLRADMDVLIDRINFGK